MWKLGAEEIAERGFDPDTVADVIGRIHRYDFKRRQAPPVLRVFSRSYPWVRVPLAARLGEEERG